MQVDDAIVAIFQHKLFKDMCKRYGGSDWEDLRSEVILVVCELSEDKKKNIVEKNYLMPYALNILKNQANFKENRRFRKLYCNTEGLVYEPSYSESRAYMQADYDEAQDRTYTLTVNRVISDAINPTDDKHYYAYLMVENANDVPLRDIADNLGVPLTSVWKGIEQYKQYVREWLKFAI